MKPEVEYQAALLYMSSDTKSKLQPQKKVKNRSARSPSIDWTKSMKPPLRDMVLC